ncbi:MAG TPA: hypothetical protein VMT76_08635 [Puia sp.]|nr:hypothetical protein [Puia sp.]
MVKDKEYSMTELLDMIEKSSSENPAPYPCIFDIPTQLPRLIPFLTQLEMKYAYPIR